MDRRAFIISTALVTTAKALRLGASSTEQSRVRLSSTAPRFANQGWFGYTVDKSAEGKPLRIGDRTLNTV
jgi:hypothetical protein